jgi:micrococcal nuclease
MFLIERLLSACSPAAAVSLAALSFVAGLGVGANLKSVTADNSAPVTTTASIAPPAEAAAAIRVAHPAEVLRVLDGDTFEARVHLWRASTLLAHGEVGIMRVSLDKYGGRVPADASTHAVTDVAASLLNAGHVRPYGGARRESWCS